MKAISEMTLEELQDYALDLEGKVNQAGEDVEKLNTTINDLHDLNKTLQKRNNELFTKLDQQRANPSKDRPGDADEPDIQTCEELAEKLFKNKEIRL